MKKVVSVGIVCLFCAMSVISVHAESSYEDIPSAQGVFDKTLVMGTIINPQVKGENLTASAVYVFYFESGLLIKKAGIVKGFTTVTMKMTPFLLLYTPGPFGFVSYVYGFAEDFTIHAE